MAIKNRTHLQTLRLLRSLPEVSRPLAAVTCAMMVLSAGIPTALMVVVGWLVAEAPKLARPATSGSAWPSVVIAICALGVLMALQQLVSALLAGLGERLGRRFALTLRERLMKAMTTPTGLAHLETPDVQDLAAVAAGVRGGYGGPMGAVVGVVQSGSTILSCLAAAGLLLVVAPAVAIPLLVVHVFVGWWSRREHQKGLSILFVDQARLRRASYFRDLVLKPGAEKEIQLFGLAPFALAGFISNWRNVMMTVWRDRHATRFGILTAYTLLAAAYALSAIQIARYARAGEIGITSLAVALQALLALLPLAMVSQWDELIQAGRDAISGLNGAERKIAASTARINELEPHNQRASQPPLAITLADVRFAYPSGGEILSGVNMSIPMGKSCAIVGRNGSGKSTLIKLLLRFYDPTSGCIRADGVPISIMNISDWRSQFAVVFQDFLRLSVPIRDAIEFGSLKGRGDPDLLDKVCHLTGLGSVLEKLPAGWNTLLSPQMRGGTDLSGGEWQKVAIARAFYALENGAEILAMDEPTASLDAESERQVYESILARGAGRTLVLISHRFSTVRKVDHIFVLDKGMITEQGSHDDLMSRKGLYAEMFNAQAALLR